MIEFDSGVVDFIIVIVQHCFFLNSYGKQNVLRHFQYVIWF